LIRRNGGDTALDDVKTGCRWRAPGWARLWGNRPGKVNQERCECAPLAGHKSRARNCHYPEPVRQARHDRTR
jgi:hypothetical protein